MGVLPICISLSTCISAYRHVCCPWMSEENITALELQSWMVERYHVDAGNRTRVLARAVSAFSSWAMPPASVLSLKGVAHITLYSHKTTLRYHMPTSVLSYTASSQLLSDIALPITFPPVSSSASSSDSNLNYHQATFICFFIHPNDHQSLFLWSQISVAHQNSAHLSPCW